MDTNELDDVVEETRVNQYIEAQDRAIRGEDLTGLDPQEIQEDRIELPLNRIHGNAVKIVEAYILNYEESVVEEEEEVVEETEL